MKKYTNLKELKAQKESIKKDLKDLEGVLTFKNPKNSLSIITGGYTDKFLKEVPDDDGGMKTTIDTKPIIQGISSQIKTQVNKNTIMQVANSAEGNDLMKNVLKLGAVTLLTKYAQKNMKSSTWKKKLVGAAIVYVAPLVLKYVSQKMSEYQKNKTAQSMEKLI